MTPPWLGVSDEMAPGRLPSSKYETNLADGVLPSRTLRRVLDLGDLFHGIQLAPRCSGSHPGPIVSIPGTASSQPTLSSSRKQAELYKLSQFASERRFRYVSPEGWRYRGHCTDTGSLHGLEGKFGGALGRS